MPKQHEVKPGDCIDSIAFDNGFFPGTVWRDPANADLRSLRGDPNILFAGDVAVVPDRAPKTVDAAAEVRHRFRLRGVPARFRLQLFKDGEPRANLAYRIDIDGWLQEGVTDAQGVLDVRLPNNARRGVLYIDEDGSEIELQFGRLAPITEDLGVRQRLANLGFLADARTTDEDELAAALLDFQQRFELPETSEADQATRNKLVEVHDHTNEMPPEDEPGQGPGGQTPDDEAPDDEPMEEEYPGVEEDEPQEVEPQDSASSAETPAADPPAEESPAETPPGESAPGGT